LYQFLDAVDREAVEMHAAGVGTDRRKSCASFLVEFVVAKRADQQQPCCPRRSDHVIDEVERRGIRPLEVVEHHHHVPVCGQRLEPTGCRVEEQQAVSFWVTDH
jgi:hypothetical protein